MKKNFSLLLLGIVLITYANGIVTTKFLNDKNILIQSLTDRNNLPCVSKDFYEQYKDLSLDRLIDALIKLKT